MTTRPIADSHNYGAYRIFHTERGALALSAGWGWGTSWVQTRERIADVIEGLTFPASVGLGPERLGEAGSGLEKQCPLRQ